MAAAAIDMRLPTTSSSRHPTYSTDANQVPISSPLSTLGPSHSSSHHGGTIAAKQEQRGTLAPPPPLAVEQRGPALPSASRSWWIVVLAIAIHVVLVAWSLFSMVRYAMAIRSYADDPQRRQYASAFLALSCVSLVVFAVSFAVGFRLPRRLHVVQQCVLFIASVTLVTPSLFNLAFVSLWKHRSLQNSTLSLVGRCHFDFDVVWSGRAGQCVPGGVAWGTWLGGAIARFLVTLIILLALHWLSLTITVGDWQQHFSPRPRPRSHSTVSLVGSSSRPNQLRRTRTNSQPGAPPMTSESTSSSRDHRRTFSSGSNTNAQILTYVPNHLIRPQLPLNSPTAGPSSSEDGEVRRISTNSAVSDYYSDVDDGGDLNRFAANFRTLVERVAKETEDASRLPSPTRSSSHPPVVRRNTPPTVASPTSSRRSSLDQHPTLGQDLQRDLLNAHRLMLLEQAMRAESYEHVLVLGGAVRRMSTIPSVTDDVEMPWTPTSGATSMYATPRELTRSPTSSTARSGRRNPVSRHYTPPSTGTSIAAPPLPADERRSEEEV